MADRRLTDGELWARAELERLRAARFSPRAVAALLAASSHRAVDVRRARPVLARQCRAWLGIGAGAWCALAVAGRQPFRRRLASGLGWWGAVAIMLDWHLGMLESEDGRPRPLGPADALTLCRAWLVPVIADDLQPAALLLAAATDVLDGMAARATQPTRAGRELEGLVDASVSVAGLVTAGRTHRLAPIAVVLEAGRLAAGLGYSAAVYLARAGRPDPALTRAARITTPLRTAGLVAAGAGRRRWADVLVVTGSLSSLAVLARSRTGQAAGRSSAPGSTRAAPATTFARPTRPTSSA